MRVTAKYLYIQKYNSEAKILVDRLQIDELSKQEP